ncbi:MAG: DUF192 domain-containing protein [Planctomycetota bacterium]
MNAIEMVDRSTGDTLLSKVRVADTFSPRLFGLMLRNDIADDEGLLFPRCSCIHMFFMSFCIDVIFLDDEKKVMKIVPCLKPWRISGCWGASFVLEAPANWAGKNDVREGMQLMLRQSGKS